MSKLIECECPNCGATIKIDNELRIIKCEYCDNEFELPEPKFFDETSLIKAISSGNIEVIKALIESGAIFWEKNSSWGYCCNRGCF